MLFMANLFNLKEHGITVAEIHRNLPPSALYEHAIRYEKDASMAENGALVAYSGAKTDGGGLILRELEGHSGL
jgi:phosphoenolpyruvate carboxykinase (ATP)